MSAARLSDAAPKRILLGHLAARGDCLYATAVARQIKADYPGCHLTWAIGSMCRSLLDGNPYVDAVWEIPLTSHDGVAAAWREYAIAARQRIERHDFDEGFFTQIYRANFRNFDCTIRASIFRGYPRPIQVPIAPIVRLRAEEVENMRRFAQRHRLGGPGADNHVRIFRRKRSELSQRADRRRHRAWHPRATSRGPHRHDLASSGRLG